MFSAMENNFIKENCKQLYLLSEDLDEIIKYIEAPTENGYSLKELKNG